MIACVPPLASYACCTLSSVYSDFEVLNTNRLSSKFEASYNSLLQYPSFTISDTCPTWIISLKKLPFLLREVSITSFENVLPSLSRFVCNFTGVAVIPSTCVMPLSLRKRPSILSASRG